MEAPISEFLDPKVVDDTNATEKPYLIFDCYSCQHHMLLREDKDAPATIIACSIAPPLISTTAYVFPTTGKGYFCSKHLPLDRRNLSCEICYYSENCGQYLECRIDSKAVIKKPGDWCGKIFFEKIITKTPINAKD